MASGRLDKGEYGNLVISETEQNCLKRCDEQVMLNDNSTAMWMVEKIRHRDNDRGYRYEFRISVMSIKKASLGSKRDVKEIEQSLKPKSFLLKDNDYPKFFAALESFDEEKATRADRRLFNTLYDNMNIPFFLNYNRRRTESSYYTPADHSNNLGGLNIGEYYARPQLLASPPATQKVFQQEPDFNFPPITFRDPIAFNRPTSEGFEKSHLPNFPTNLHHHYYLNNNGLPIFTASAFEQQQNGIDAQNNKGAILFPPQAPTMRTTLKPLAQIARYKGQYVFPTEGSQAPLSDIQPRVPIVPEADLGMKSYNQVLEFPYDLNNHLGGKPFIYQYQQTYPSASGAFLNVNNINPPTLPPQQPLYPTQQFSTNSPVLNDFRSSFVYQPDIFSEPDPLFHGPIGPLLVTPVNFVSTSETNPNSEVVVSPVPALSAEVQSQRPVLPQVNVIQANQTASIISSPLPQNELPRLRNRAPIIRTKFPDSINAQLPPPESGVDFRVPYVDATVVTQTSYSPINGHDSTTSQDHLQVEHSETVTSETQTNHPSTSNKPKKVSRVRVRSRGTQSSILSSDKPVLKWVPKRSHVMKVAKVYSESGSSEEQGSSALSTTHSNEASSTENVVVVTPMHGDNVSEPSTKLSISKTVSVKVGPKRKTVIVRKKLAVTTTVAPDNNESTDVKIFLPTLVPDTASNATQQYIYFNETMSETNAEDHVLTKVVKTLKKRTKKVS